jgi:hypothetical protein
VLQMSCKQRVVSVCRKLGYCKTKDEKRATGGVPRIYLADTRLQRCISMAEYTIDDVAGAILEHTHRPNPEPPLTRPLLATSAVESLPESRQ